MVLFSNMAQLNKVIVLCSKNMFLIFSNKIVVKIVYIASYGTSVYAIAIVESILLYGMDIVSQTWEKIRWHLHNGKLKIFPEDTILSEKWYIKIYVPFLPGGNLLSSVWGLLSSIRIWGHLIIYPLVTSILWQEKQNTNFPWCHWQRLWNLWS